MASSRSSTVKASGFTMRLLAYSSSWVYAKWTQLPHQAVSLDVKMPSLLFRIPPKTNFKPKCIRIILNIKIHNYNNNLHIILFLHFFYNKWKRFTMCGVLFLSFYFQEITFYDKSYFFNWSHFDTYWLSHILEIS